MDHIEQQLIDAIDGWRDEMISLCSKLLQTPSVNGVHDERRMAEALDRAAQQFGLHTQIVGENPKRPNIVASTAPGGPTGLLLVGHTDTVPSGDMQHWTHPAFSGHVDEEAGRI